MKRLLVVSPSFPPISAADVHRVRTSLPFYREFGWEPFVLAVAPAAHGGMIEPDLVRTVPADVSVTRTGALPASLTRWVGVGNVGLRAWPELYAAGANLIREHRIDLVYFSTTMFPAVSLGRLWKARFGAPYVIDMQDPWKSEYRGAGTPRGLKARAARALHGMLEPFAMRQVDGIISVSPAYSETLCRRYPSVHADMCTTIPFGASLADFETARGLPWRNPFFDRADGRRHGVAVGRGGADLATAAGILFQACRLRRERESGAAPLRLWFVGTDYASDVRRRTIAPVAAAAGVADIVEESPARVPYLDGLRLLADAHMSIILGSDDPAYSPSKVYPYLMAGRPFVAVVHESSPVVPLLQQSGLGVVATFRTDTDSDAGAIASRLAGELTPLVERGGSPAVPPPIMEAIGARELTRRQCLAFEAAIRHASPQGIPCVE